MSKAQLTVVVDYFMEFMRLLVQQPDKDTRDWTEYIIYKHLLQNTLEKIAPGNNGLEYERFGFHILAQLAKKREKFINELEELMQLSYPELKTHAVLPLPPQLVLVEYVWPLVFASGKQVT